ncbi:MAG TPA: hypothetical protein VKS01_03080, partial [Bryobacteraceae bacterium]|nr:hypothetical protein [Bryobacteraceae bacterium]
MNWLPSGVGAEPKKLVILGVLILAGIATYFFIRPDSNSSSAPASAAAKASPAADVPDPPAAPVRSPASAVNAAPARRSAGGPPIARRGGHTLADEFHPSIKAPEGVDLTTIDPTIHMDLLARLRDLPMEGGTRSVFKEGAPPPPDPVVVKPKPMLVGPMLPEPKHTE